MRPTRLEVNLGAVVKNSKLVSDVSGVPVWCVVKANGYGAGASQLATVLEPNSWVRGFAVSLVGEGIDLRRNGVKKPILVMGPALRGSYENLISNKLIAVLSTLDDALSLAKAAEKAGTSVPVHVKLDTGMGRLGFLADSDVERVCNLDGIEVVGVSTHFSDADLDDPKSLTSKTMRQIENFKSRVLALGLAGVEKHAANSAGSLRFSDSSFDAVRSGLALLGAGGFSEKLQSALVLKTAISQVRQLGAGESVSYGSLWQSKRESIIAVLPVGYADGIPRRGTGKLSVAIGKTLVPIVGAVSMDMILADITDAPGLSVGDEVTVFGDDIATVKNFATACEQIEYEVFCGMSLRVKREYLTD